MLFSLMSQPLYDWLYNNIKSVCFSLNARQVIPIVEKKHSSDICTLFRISFILVISDS